MIVVTYMLGSLKRITNLNYFSYETLHHSVDMHGYLCHDKFWDRLLLWNKGLSEADE